MDSFKVVDSCIPECGKASSAGMLAADEDTEEENAAAGRHQLSEESKGRRSEG